MKDWLFDHIIEILITLALIALIVAAVIDQQVCKRCQYQQQAERKRRLRSGVL